MLRRFGLIGDVHAEDEFLEAALDHLAHVQVDRVLCVGDLVDGRGDVDRCVELLERHGVDTVRGNHDRWIVNDQERDLPHATVLDALAPRTQWHLAHLPVTRRYETVAGPLLLCHGLGHDDMAFIYPDGKELRRHVDSSGRARLRTRGQLGVEPDIRIVVDGHTHVRMAQRFGRLTIINAGTLRDGDTPCFSVVDLGSRVVQFYDLDEGGRVMESERLRIE